MADSPLRTYLTGLVADADQTLNGLALDVMNARAAVDNSGGSARNRRRLTGANVMYEQGEKTLSWARALLAEYDARFSPQKVTEKSPSRIVEQGEDGSDYEILRDTIIEAFNPPDDDVAEVSLMLDAVDRSWGFIVGLPCNCDSEADEQCDRCLALGRAGNVRIER